MLEISIPTVNQMKPGAEGRADFEISSNVPFFEAACEILVAACQGEATENEMKAQATMPYADIVEGVVTQFNEVESRISKVTQHHQLQSLSCWGLCLSHSR